MQIKYFIDALQRNQIDFFTGVPDSLLKPLCDYLMETYQIDPAHHIVAHNEGGCVGLAAGYYLATAKTPCVYLQNSGIGNIVNPLASLTHPQVYGIPTLYVVGWRGEPGVHDEPQHTYQGKVTIKLLEEMQVAVTILDENTTEEELDEALRADQRLFAEGHSAAFVVRKGAFTAAPKIAYANDNTMTREESIRLVAEAAGQDILVSTTGKASRELFEIREAQGIGHGHDFLTVGSMGHSAMIALGVALNKPSSRVWCLDGDGALLMHMGVLGVVASQHPEHFVHIVFNNGAHETVGGVPTVAETMKLPELARAAGYAHAYSAGDEQTLRALLPQVKVLRGPVFLEIKVDISSRADLGRPTTTAQENRIAFMKYLEDCE